MAGNRIWIGKDRSRREVVDTVLGMTNVERLSNAASLDLPLIIQLFVEENVDTYQFILQQSRSFVSKAACIRTALGIGGKKAQQMVEIRGRVGFKSWS